MTAYSLRSGRPADEDIYDVTPVESLEQLVTPGHSLCLAHHPEWLDGSRPETQRITGHDGAGQKDCLEMIDCAGNPGRVKDRLVRSLKSPFLFVSWKKCGVHGFRICNPDGTAVEYDNFKTAMQAYLPEGFIPEKRYARTHSVVYLSGLMMRRKFLFRKLVDSLACRTKKADSDK